MKVPVSANPTRREVAGAGAAPPAGAGAAHGGAAPRAPRPAPAGPRADSPRPRSSGGTHTPCTWHAWSVADPISALKTTRPSPIRAQARPAAITAPPRPRAGGRGAPAAL